MEAELILPAPLGRTHPPRIALVSGMTNWEDGQLLAIPAQMLDALLEVHSFAPSAATLNSERTKLDCGTLIYEVALYSCKGEEFQSLSPRESLWALRDFGCELLPVYADEGAAKLLKRHFRAITIPADWKVVPNNGAAYGKEKVSA